ncbi:MAG: hypothetical protein A2138_11260 [Deltaproteobacteria bacterium RBG_16_71_12]|nr:MAG: hypothetical protein A2138_11260 [Deltaproteobacteria bacterium RBG_16_71_12]
MLAAVAVTGIVAACSVGGLYPMPQAGATPGGVQDMWLARDLIARGQVPPPEAFVVEGMFSEHDLPLAGEPCSQPLCLRAAAGVAPKHDGAARGFVQVGMSSGIDADAWQPPPMTLVMTVDVSSSMGFEQGETTPGEMSRTLLRQIVERLRDEDRVAIVTYGSTSQTALPLTSVAERARILAVVEALTTDGSTNMEAGLRLAYQTAPFDEDGDGDVRVMLFTDTQPNVGATEASQFEELVADGAARGVGLTVFGMGVGVGQELFAAMGNFRGGNAYGVVQPDDVARVLDDSWPFLLSPIANGLEMTLTPDAGATVSAAYGFPGGGTSLSVASVFLSKRRGALLVELDGLAPGFSAAGTLRYTVPGQAASIEEDLSVAHDGVVDERGHGYQQPSVAKAVALALLVTGMRAAAERYQADQDDEAVAGMEVVAARIAEDADATDDPALEPEVALAQALLELLRAGAPQGSLYGGY